MPSGSFQFLEDCHHAYAATGADVGRPSPSRETSYRRVFETATDGIAIVDTASRRILDVNASMAQLMGCPKIELLGKELWQVGVFADIDVNRAAFRALRKQDTLRYEHLPLRTKTGRAVDIELLCKAYVARGCRVVQCNVRDITERRRLDQQLQEQVTALAELNRRKDEFLAVLSHELRNPLSAIVSAAHLLRHESCGVAVHETASTMVERQAKRLSMLIDDVLEIVRVTTGRMRMRRERIDLRCVVEHAVETIRPLVACRKHQLSLVLPSEPVWLDVDAGRMEQVVSNLLTNAAKYALEAGHIALVVEREDAEIVLRVRDTGIGISPKLLPHVFELFTQANTALDRPEDGLGIGLAVVQRLVEMHGGTVAAYSPGLGLGSEFVVRLPAIASLASPRAAARQPSPKAKGLAEKRRLLIVDSDADAADTLAELLRVFGHEVNVAYSGGTALEAAASDPPDAVLMDIALPDMSGYEIAAKLRQDPKVELNGVCLIATTRFAMSRDLALIRKAGFDHHFVKPVDPRKLQHLVAELAAHRAPAARSAGHCEVAKL